MLVVISPAKTLDFESPVKTQLHSEAEYVNEAAELVDSLRKMNVAEVKTFMGISPKLAEVTHKYINDWHLPFVTENAKQALFAFQGDVYGGLEAETLSQDDYEYSQRALRILSGLYGVLNPLDLIQPYRLEMGKKLATENAKDLYVFWADKIADRINRDIEKNGHDVLVNLASNEYFKAVKSKLIKYPIVTPVFKEEKGNKYQVVAVHAKKARGLMTRFIIQNKLSNVDDLKAFDDGGYQYMDNLSNKKELVFIR